MKTADRIGLAPENSRLASLALIRERLLAERVPLGEEIAAYLRELIMSGQLRSGQSLNIETLAKDLETSATPVREALLGLKGEGFVLMEPRRGFRVAPLSRQDVEDMFLIQSMIAGELTARAAAAATDQFIEEVSGLQAGMIEADRRSDDDELERLNFEFHRTINRTTASPKLAWLLGLVVRYVPRIFYATIAGWNEASLRDHAAIIDAIRDRDADAARRAMAQHIQHVGDLLVSHLEKQGFWSTAADAPVISA
ncbi:MAG TPA: GntR family transcriptional regulator [Candidatus Limnocylindrales bacterium]|nr:GntR family transcriptional regulator [Candidatus Limnocylindrales bacterium]